MCKVKKTYPLWGFLLSFPLWTVSCVDNKYDLDKDIDMTVNVGGEHLTIPAGSSDTAYLSKIIEVEEGDILQPDATTRVYHLTKKDDINVEPTTVKEVTIDETTTNLSSTEIVNATSVTDEEVLAPVTTSGDFEAKSNNIDEALKELGIGFCFMLSIVYFDAYKGSAFWLIVFGLEYKRNILLDLFFVGSAGFRLFMLKTV